LVFNPTNAVAGSFKLSRGRRRKYFGVPPTTLVGFSGAGQTYNLNACFIFSLTS
jgi:hypothetical protein